VRSESLYLIMNHSLTAFYQAAIEHELPIAMWRVPNSTEKQAIVAWSNNPQPRKLDFTQQVAGFAFSPFINRDGQATLFIKADVYFKEARQPELMTPLELVDQPLWTSFLASYQNNSPRPLSTWHLPTQAKTNAFYNQAEFCHLVEQAIGYMRSTHLQKIVASRAIDVPLQPTFNLLHLFELLCERYPRAMVSLVSMPQVGTWIGASPEILLTQTNSCLKTIALAGTQAYHPEQPLPQVAWGQKEVVEQALVSEYIRDLLQELEVTDFVENGPKTVVAGNVVHLRTSFTLEAEHRRLARLSNQILDKLHPTSAVCGMPRQEALDFILTHEGYDREFYAGFLGPVRLHGQSQLYVNLRCMQLQATKAVAYVGAGITVDSNPQAEWEETILKSNTLLSVLPLAS